MGSQSRVFSLLNFHSQPRFTFFKHLKAKSGVWLNFAEVTLRVLRKPNVTFAPGRRCPTPPG